MNISDIDQPYMIQRLYGSVYTINSGQWSVRREEPFQQLYSNILFGIQQSLFGSMISSLHIPSTRGCRLQFTEALDLSCEFLKMIRSHEMLHLLERKNKGFHQALW